MKPLKPKRRARLLAQIAGDIEASAALVKAAAASASHHASAGREQEALRHLLEVEGEIFDAGRLITLAAYIARLGKPDTDSDDCTSRLPD